MHTLSVLNVDCFLTRQTLSGYLDYTDSLCLEVLYLNSSLLRCLSFQVSSTKKAKRPQSYHVLLDIVSHYWLLVSFQPEARNYNSRRGALTQEAGGGNIKTLSTRGRTLLRERNAETQRRHSLADAGTSHRIEVKVAKWLLHRGHREHRERTTNILTGFKDRSFVYLVLFKVTLRLFPRITWRRFSFSSNREPS